MDEDKLQRAHKKLLEALRDNKFMSKEQMIAETGYPGIDRRISDLNNQFGYNIAKIKQNGVYKYTLVEDAEEVDSTEVDEEEYGNITYEVSKKSIKDVDEALKNYYKLIRDAKKETKPIKNEQYKLSKDKESLVIVNSDWHFGKKVLDEYGKEVYNSQIAHDRLDTFYRNTKKLIKHIINSTEIDEIVLTCIGDLIDGESIYSGQIYHIDEYLTGQVENATRALWKQIEILQDEFHVPVRLESVVGNHGRGHANYEGMTNFDSLVELNLGILRDITKNSQLIIPEGHNMKERITNVRGHKLLLRHYAPNQIETPAAFKRYAGWLEIYKYDCLISGHFHSPKISYFQTRPIIRNGSLIGDDEYSRELGYTAKPTQIIFGVNEKRIPTFSYTLDMM